MLSAAFAAQAAKVARRFSCSRSARWRASIRGQYADATAGAAPRRRPTPHNRRVMPNARRDLPMLHGDRVTLRGGTPKDAGELRRLFEAPDVARWWPTPGDDELETLLRNGDPDVDVWLIELEGRVVGLIQAYEEHDPMYRH